MLCILCAFGTHGAEITVQLLWIKPLMSYLRMKQLLTLFSSLLLLSRLSTVRA